MKKFYNKKHQSYLLGGLIKFSKQTMKRRMGHALGATVLSSEKCLNTIIRVLRWAMQKTFNKIPFEAHFGRLPRTEFKF